MQDTAQRLKVNGEVVARMVGDEAILLDLASGTYFTLNAVGAVAWRGLEIGHSIDEIVATVVDKYEVDNATARADIEEYIGALLSEGLVVPA